VYAVIETGGRQYRVTPGEVIEVNRLPAEVGQIIDLTNVLMVGGIDGGCLVGRPTLPGAVVRARVAAHPRSRKILVLKYKPKVRYRRHKSHRQDLTRLVIRDIIVGTTGESSAGAPADH
jgi:large subunit ribosomal protein L21